MVVGTSESRITLIAAGGTISQIQDARSGKSVPLLTAADLWKQVSFAKTIDIRLVDFSPPADAVTSPDMLLRFAHCIQEEAKHETGGIVVTHGTDTMEEVAYLIDEAVATAVPLVFTGAMRPSWASGYDGVRNLENAFRVAQTVPAEYGTLVTMNDEIFEAWSVYKSDTGALDAFTPRRGAAYGRIFGTRVVMTWRPIPRRRFLQLPKELPGSIPIVTAGVDDDAIVLSQVDTLPLAGVVVASMAAGHISTVAYRRILALAECGMPVVLCSSSTSGRTAEEYYYPRAYDDLRTAGVVIEDWLSPRKARMRLLLSVGLQVPYVPFGQEFVLSPR